MNKQATIPLYIRFGDIPKDGRSKVHRGDEVVRDEGGVSVFRAVKANGCYYPLLPEDANEDGVADYFDFLLHSDKEVFFVTGTEIFLEGADREPLLRNVKILKEITHYYRAKRGD